MIKKVWNFYQSLKENMKIKLKKIKMMNRVVRDRKLKNSPKNYWKIEFYLINHGKTKIWLKFWTNWKNERD